MSKQHNEPVKEYPFASKAKVNIRDYITKDQRGFKVDFTIMKPLTTKNNAWDMVTNLTYSVPSTEIEDVQKFFTILQKTNISTLRFCVSSIYLHSSCGFWYHLTHWNKDIIDNFTKQNSDAFIELACNKKIINFEYWKWDYLYRGDLTSLEKDFLKGGLLEKDMNDLLRHKEVKKISLPQFENKAISSKFFPVGYYTDLVTYFIQKIATQSSQQQYDFLNKGDDIVTHDELIKFAEYKNHVSEKYLVKEIRKKNLNISDEEIKKIFVQLLIMNANSEKPSSSSQEAPEAPKAPETTIAEISLLPPEDCRSIVGTIEWAEEASNS